MIAAYIDHYRGLPPSLAEQAARWEIPIASILADQAYGDDTAFRT